MITRYKNLILLGTSHIASQSIKEITQTVTSEKPTVIAVELDQRRLYALLQKKRPGFSFSFIRRIGVKGTLFALLGSWVQQKMGRFVGVEPGADMLTAVKLAKSHNIKLALIDQDIEITLQNFSKALSWKERFRFIGDLIRAVFFQKRELHRLGLENLDLRTVPSRQLIRRLTKELQDRYPNVYRVLIEERNQVMATKLHTLMDQFSEGIILAVVGAGHEEDLLARLDSHDTQTTYQFTLNLGNKSNPQIEKL